MPPTFDLGRTLRTGRRRCDLSQRQLATAAGISPGTIARLEADPTADPRLSTLVQAFAALGMRVAGLDLDSGTELIPHVSDEWRDAAGRHLPAHLEPIPTVGADDYLWWGWLRYSTWSYPPIPAHTYFVNRRRRDAVRRHMDPGRDWVYPGPRPGPSPGPTPRQPTSPRTTE